MPNSMFQTCKSQPKNEHTKQPTLAKIPIVQHGLGNENNQKQVDNPSWNEISQDFLWLYTHLEGCPRYVSNLNTE